MATINDFTPEELDALKAVAGQQIADAPVKARQEQIDAVLADINARCQAEIDAVQLAANAQINDINARYEAERQARIAEIDAAEGG